jgi:trimethylamine---corrinoid protein Co-methyltransferase
MARERRRRGRVRGTDQDDRGGLPQLPWQIPSTAGHHLKLLSDDQVEAIHLTSLRILEELGVEMLSERALELFAAGGASVDRATNTVKLDRGMVAKALETVPSRYTLTPRNPDHAVPFGGDDLIFSLVAGPPNSHDRERGRRAGNYNDYVEFMKLAQYFNAIHMIGNQVVAPVELPANTRHMDTYHAAITYTDLAFHVSAIGRARALDGIKMMAISRGLSLEEAAKSPGITTIISVNSPRRFDSEMAEGLMVMAEHGQPVCITPFTLMGAMTPVTLPAALAQQNAEALFGVVLTQLVNPGVPVSYGAFTSNVDMRSGAPAFGTPENTKANIISGQLTRRYGIPYRSSNSNASNTVDAQAAYETLMATWGAVLGGANIIYHAAGWLEGGLTASYEKLVLDVEILQHMIELLKPVQVDEASLGLDAVASVDPGGHFFGAEHTMERYETAFYTPLLSDWTNYENWQDAGSQDAYTRATGIWKRALDEYVQPPMDPAIAEELDTFMAKRREEIGSDEP